MDLYEALKSGTSSEELEASFHKQLATARAKIAAEEKAKEDKHQADIATARKNIVAHLYNYAKLLMGDSFNPELFSTEEAEKLFIEYEDTLKESLKLSEELDKILNESKEKKTKIYKSSTKWNDDDIIEQFLKSL